MNKDQLIGEVLVPFFRKVREESFITRDIPKVYDDEIKIKVRFGSGRYLDIPWVGFMGGGYTNQRGLYVPVTYYRNHGVALLTYGVSYRYPSPIEWGKLDRGLVGDFFAERGTTLKKGTEWKYNERYFYGAYEVGTDGVMDGATLDRLAGDIAVVVEEYKVKVGLRGI